MSDWPRTLRELQTDLQLTQEELANKLGITARTLSDLMKDNARPPTQSVQLLVQRLHDEKGILSQSRHSVVLIHGSFDIRGYFTPEESAISFIVERIYGFDKAHENIEFHFISYLPKLEPLFQAVVYESMARMRVTPHLLTPRIENDPLAEAALDCHFVQVATRIISEAASKGLAHVTLAANPLKIWPLAKWIETEGNGRVTIISDASPREGSDPEGLDSIISMGITAVPAISLGNSQHSTGTVTLVQKGADGGEFGFIAIEADPLRAGDTPVQSVFFSWNHVTQKESYRRARGNRMIPFAAGTRVTFRIGMNYKGLCAIDVTATDNTPITPHAVERRAFAPTSPAQGQDDANGLDKDAIARVLADVLVDTPKDAEGAVLMSVFGNRMLILRPDIKERLATLGYPRYKEFVGGYTDLFEFLPGPQPGTDRLRLKTPPETCPARPRPNPIRSSRG